jgi:hypothetical protein
VNYTLKHQAPCTYRNRVFKEPSPAPYWYKSMVCSLLLKFNKGRSEKSALAYKRWEWHRLQLSTFLGLLAKMKCSICSYLLNEYLWLTRLKEFRMFIACLTHACLCYNMHVHPPCPHCVCKNLSYKINPKQEKPTAPLQAWLHIDAGQTCTACRMGDHQTNQVEHHTDI